MSPRHMRARMLYRQGRYAEAERELRHLVGEDPQDCLAHVLLAFCIAQGEKKRLPEAEAAAREGLRLGPDEPMAHLGLGAVMAAGHRFKEARQAIERAIQLDPHDADTYGYLASVHNATQRWREAVETAQRGLAIDPKNAECLNQRSIALTRLGREGDAQDAINQTLRENPQNADAHANRGWLLLRQGKHRESLEQFREALRIDPENEWARAGLVEALKARNPVYRVLLSWVFWMLRLDDRVRIGVLIGMYVLYRVLRSVAANNPGVEPFIQPFLIAYIAFALLTWLGDPLFNLLLRCSRYGRHALSKDQRVASNWFGGLLLSAIAALVVGLAVDLPVLVDVAFLAGLMLLPVSNVFATDDPSSRRRRAAVAGAMGCGAAAVLLLSAFDFDEQASLLFQLWLYGFIAFVFIGAFASAKRPAA